MQTEVKTYKNIIFMDFVGVIVPKKTLLAYMAKMFIQNKGKKHIDLEKASKALNQNRAVQDNFQNFETLIKEFDLNVVFSSNLKYRILPKEMINFSHEKKEQDFIIKAEILFKEHNILLDRLVGVTPYIHGNRVEEINAWNEMCSPCEYFVLDDDKSIASLGKKRCVIPNSNKGFDLKMFKFAREKLQAR